MDAYLRIGELSRRAGVSPELLRAWERRYGLLRPKRSSGGFRLYGDDDVRRVRAMQENLERGLSAAEAARLAVEVTAASSDTAPAPPRDLAADLLEAFERYDEVAAHAVIDRLISTYSLDTVLRDVLLPVLSEIGVRYERGELTVAQEHFASHLLRGRLMGLARGWGQGAGPTAVLACPPGEQHEFGLIAFGLALRARGWRITYLGADTPIETLRGAVAEVEPQLVVVASELAEPLLDASDALASLAREAPLAVAGAGASTELARRAGARLLEQDPVTAAEQVTGEQP